MSQSSPFAKPRILIEAQMLVLSPLHVGSGESSGENQLPKLDDGSQPELNLILRCENGQPYIPGTTLKGVMRGLCTAENDKHALFGQIKDENSGQMGQIIVLGAAVSNGLGASPFPHFMKDKASGAMARTRIDGKKGIALDKHLYHDEEVPKGTVFSFKMWLMSGDESLPPTLSQLLAKMQNEFALGAGTREGQGRVALSDVTATVYKIDASSGELKPGKKTKIAKPAAGAASANTIVLKLTCNGPYLVNDSSWRKDHDGKYPNGQEKAPQLKALGLDWNAKSSNPMLPGSSLKGALRAESMWLEQSDGPLTAELFGTTERAARLIIRSIKTISNTPTIVPSVKLDRFSGAAFDGGLFETWCFVNPEFEVKMECEAGNDAKLHALKLLEHLKKHGIKLGHGTNRGYGWFKVT